MKLFKKIFKVIDNLISNKIIKWIIIPLILLFLWLSFSLVYSSYKSFTVLQYPQNQDASNNFFDKKLLKGQKLTGEFVAKDNSLGIVTVRFGYIPRVDFKNEDIILFRIKEKNNKEWSYVNKYRLGSFTSNQFYPFGFKEIEKSKGKAYEFEIISKKGSIGNSLSTKHTNPIYLTKYKYSRSEVFKNISSVIGFMKEKVITFVSNSDSLLSSIVFMLPFIFYITWISFLQKKMVKNQEKITGKNLFIALLFTLIVFETIFYEFLITGLMLGFLGLWVFLNYVNRLKSNVTFILAFTLLIISVFSIYFNLDISIDKATTYAYLLIIIGFIQSIYDHKHN